MVSKAAVAGVVVVGSAVAGTAWLLYQSGSSLNGPNATVTPGSGGPGTTFVLGGKNFPPNTTQFFIVTGPGGIVTINQFPVTVNADGTFSPVNLPYNTTVGKGIYVVVWSNNIAPKVNYTQTA